VLEGLPGLDDLLILVVQLERLSLVKKLHIDVCDGISFGQNQYEEQIPLGSCEPFRVDQDALSKVMQLKDLHRFAGRVQAAID